MSRGNKKQIRSVRPSSHPRERHGAYTQGSGFSPRRPSQGYTRVLQPFPRGHLVLFLKRNLNTASPALGLSQRGPRWAGRMKSQGTPFPCGQTASYQQVVEGTWAPVSWPWVRPSCSAWRPGLVASGGGRRTHRWLVRDTWCLAPGLGISGRSWSPAPSASRFGPLADSSQGRGRNTQPTCQLGPPPASGAFPVLAPEAAQGHLRDGHPGRNQCVT